MYNRILLTLDTSELAEQAVPHAVALARNFDAELYVLSVIPVLESDSPATAEMGWDSEIATTEEYLAGIENALSSEGLTCHTELRRGNVAEEILIFSEKCEADVIVMSTHGRSGLGRWVYGSVTDRVLRYADIPVFLVRVDEEEA
ncbi:MAG: universal stress protein [Armatimonadota bacterium]